jgi:hypothetical protein
MALTVERLSMEQLTMEGAERKAKAALLPASTAGQHLLRDVTMALVENREAKKKEEASEEKKGNKEMHFRLYPTVPTNNFRSPDVFCLFFHHMTLDSVV